MEGPLYWFGQFLGVVAVVLGFLIYQVRTQKKLLLMQTITIIVFIVHYLLIGATSGMALNVVGLIRNLVYARRDRKIFSGKFWPIAFSVLMGIIGLLSWQSWYSVFVVLGLVINTYCMSFTSPQSVRKSILVTSPLVLIYDLFARSLGGSIFEAVAVISAAIGILRNRTKESHPEN